MRICCYNLTAGIKTGGLETFTWGLAGALLARGHDVEVVAGCGGVAAPGNGVKLVGFDYTPRERFPDLGTRFRKFAERLSFARNAFAYVRDGGFDAVLINKPYDFPVLRWLRHRGFSGVTCYNSGGTEFYSGDRWLSRAVDLWLPCSAYNAGKIAPHFGCDYVILNNGVDVELFCPQGPRCDLHAMYSIPAAAKIVISVGRLVGLKGLHVIVEALRELPDFHFVIVGHGAERNRLENLAQTLGVAGRIHFAGEIRHADLPPLLRGADMFVQPSVSEEAFGISVAEAMAVGLPALASDGWGLREVIANGESGLLVAPGEVNAWRDALSSVAADLGKAAAMGNAGRLRIAQNFTWSMAAETFERNVEGVIRGRKGQG